MGEKMIDRALKLRDDIRQKETWLKQGIEGRYADLPSEDTCMDYPNKSIKEMKLIYKQLQRLINEINKYYKARGFNFYREATNE